MITLHSDICSYEQDWLTHCLNTSVPYTTSTDPGLQPAVIVYSSHQPFPTELVNHYKENKINYGLIMLSDEGLNHPLIKELEDPYCKFLLRNYVHPKTAGHPKVEVFPLGYKSGFNDDTEQVERALTWSFSGSIHSKERLDAVVAFLPIEPHFIHKVSGFGAPDGLPTNEYRKTLNKSIFAICPMGHVNNDTFRLTEALEAGCIPVVRKNANVYGLVYEPSYWHFLFKGATYIPFVLVDDWQEAVTQVSALLENKEELTKRQSECLEFWHIWKNNTVSTFRNRINSLL